MSEQLDHDPGAPSQQAWRRKLNSHADFLTEFRVTFMEAVRMVNFFSWELYPSQEYMIIGCQGSMLAMSVLWYYVLVILLGK